MLSGAFDRKEYKAIHTCMCAKTVLAVLSCEGNKNFKLNSCLIYFKQKLDFKSVINFKRIIMMHLTIPEIFSRYFKLIVSSQMSFY